MINKDYYLGLDIGTDSVGWAVTDGEYNLLKMNGKTMWGARLFDSAKTAAERRMFRSTRRRNDRKKQRINLLQELFAEEICEIDPGFYQRMKDSSLYKEDKQDKQVYSLFSGNAYSDVQYHRDYPTIYHLRKNLIESSQQFDVRLVYLAIHHIIKHRGHFLFEGNDVKKVTSFQTTYNRFIQCLQDELDIFPACNSITQVESILKDKKTSKSSKKTNLIGLFCVEKTDVQFKAIISLIVGLKAKLCDIFNDALLKEIDKPSISFDDSSFEETQIVLEGVLQERYYVIDVLKSVYNWAILSEALDGGELNGKSYISVAKVKKHEKHHSDLKILKKVIKKYCTKDDYKELFVVEGKENYCAYIGMTRKNGRKKSVKKCTKEEFYKKVNTILNKISEDDYDIETIKKDIESDTFMPLQVSKDNSVIPYQVHKMELIQILDNARLYLPFLNNMDESGFSVKDKIIKLFEFRIPYYIGPINTTHDDFSWMKRKQQGPIRPWNFDSKVDLDKTAERFIRRMTNKCTYLVGNDVIPKHSLLYSEFMVWNELNNVKIKQEKLPIDVKKKIVHDLFQKKKKVTDKMLVDYLKTEGYEVAVEDLSGFDSPFKASLSSYQDFKNDKLFGESINEHAMQKIAEDIILWVTLYSEDKSMLRRVIRNHYPEDVISDAQLKEISRLSYKGWGRLSREFLEELEGTDKETGECMSIIQALRNTNNNLMQLLSKRYSFSDEVEKENNKLYCEVKEITYDSLVKDIVASPAIKRSVWQTLKITEEIKKVTGNEPKRIFIEVARGPEEKKRTKSRQEKLLELYKNCASEEREWKKELENTPESIFRSDKLFLYYTQMGKCMYTGKRISLSELANVNIYDKDHIYPQSKTKDDSIDNLVLVDRKVNAKKSDGIISTEIQRDMEPFWRSLKDRNFISQTKYERLTRRDRLTEEELANFINRQLVETRQSSKIVANILQNVFPSSKIIYVKAKTVSDFRHENLKIIKVREVNDYHHARDAYLNIVVGNVYYTKFSDNPLKWIKDNPNVKYNLNKMYVDDIYQGKDLIWKRGNDGTIALVRKVMQKNDVLYTRHSTCNKGGFFDQQMKGKDEKASIPIKKGMDVKKYGGYKSVTPSHFMLVESLKKNQKIRTIESVPLHKVKEFEENPGLLLEYCEQEYKLDHPKLIIPKIKKNAYMVIGGFPMHLRGTTGKQLSVQGAVQLCISLEQEAYLKRIINYLNRNTARKDKKTLLKMDDDSITNELNLKLYDIFYNKQMYSIYSKRPASQEKTLKSGRDEFCVLPLEEQCVVLGEILHLFQCKPLVANLKLIGGSVNSGSMHISKVITSFNSAKLVHCSVTGLFEQEIDLLKI